MATDLQLNANRQNAQQSTGPKTDAGKAASSQNSFRHGLTAANVRMLVGENIQDYLDLGNGLTAEHRPTTITEEALVDKMVHSLWMSRRAANLQQDLFDRNSEDKDLFALYMRLQTMHDRALSRALSDLSKLRKDARQLEIGFVSQNQKEELHVAKVRNITARSEAHETATQVRKSRHAATFSAAPLTSENIQPGADGQTGNALSQ